MKSASRSLPPHGAGGDLRLPVAGLGGRSYAFLLDWHIRAFAGIAWYAASVWILDRGFLPTQTDATFWWSAAAPALAIYLLYHPGFEILTASTPGKRLAGVRIVDPTGRTPSIGALVIRNALRPVDAFAFYAVGIVCVLLTRQAVRLGDIAAGTLLVYADPEDDSPTRPGRPPP